MALGFLGVGFYMLSDFTIQSFICILNSPQSFRSLHEVINDSLPACSGVSLRSSTWSVTTLMIRSGASHCVAKHLEVFTLEIHPPALDRFSRLITVAWLARPILKCNFLIVACVFILRCRLDLLDEG